MTQTDKRTQIATAVITALATLTLTLATGWLTFAHEVVSRSETIELIEKRTPYLVDREVLMSSIKQNTTRTEQLETITRQLERQNVRVETKLDMLISHMIDSAGNSDGMIGR